MGNRSMRLVAVSSIITIIGLLAISILTGLTTPALAKSNNFPQGFCTWYAAQRFNAIAPEPGINWGGNANTWYANATAKKWNGSTNPMAPKNSAIVVWGGGLGHVAIVVSRFSGGINITEMNYGNPLPGFNDSQSPNYAKTANFGKTTSARLTWTTVANRNNMPFIGYIYPEQVKPPLPPSGFKAIAISKNQINLIWSAPVGATGYLIERKTAYSNWIQVSAFSSNIPSYSDSYGLNPNVTYYYRIRATNAWSDCSRYSTVVSVKTKK